MPPRILAQTDQYRVVQADRITRVEYLHTVDAMGVEAWVRPNHVVPDSAIESLVLNAFARGQQHANH